MPEFSYSDLLPTAVDSTEYRLVTSDGVRVEKLGDRTFLMVEPSTLATLTETAIHDI